MPENFSEFQDGESPESEDIKANETKRIENLITASEGFKELYSALEEAKRFRESNIDSHSDIAFLNFHHVIEKIEDARSDIDNLVLMVRDNLERDDDYLFNLIEESSVVFEVPSTNGLRKKVVAFLLKEIRSKLTETSESTNESDQNIIDYNISILKRSGNDGLGLKLMQQSFYFPIELEGKQYFYANYGIWVNRLTGRIEELGNSNYKAYFKENSLELKDPSFVFIQLKIINMGNGFKILEYFIPEDDHMMAKAKGGIKDRLTKEAANNLNKTFSSYK
ncbi:MAG: hypothetical protein EXS49_00415 [Candidatus Pacebacteria bacterium]|nr:hypothetical protein [Candidatus Paceibacterota bacterium]